MKIIGTALLILFLTGIGYAQDFHGEATYMSKRKIDFPDSTQANSEFDKEFRRFARQKMKKTFILSFNKEASLYKEEENLEPSDMVGFIRVKGDVEDAILYKNTKEQRYVSETAIFGKPFLIKDILEKQDWKIGAETKNIGAYTCYKATWIREVKRPRTRITRENSDTKMEEITITAWYTPQIPVNNGPGNYHGLPGLILEANDGTETVICSKIVLNPKKKFVIKEPTKGKKVNQEEYDAIQAKKIEEIENQREGNSKSFKSFGG